MCCRNFSDAAAPVYILPCRGAETQNARAMGILSPCNMNAAHRARAGAVTIALSLCFQGCFPFHFATWGLWKTMCYKGGGVLFSHARPGP